MIAAAVAGALCGAALVAACGPGQEPEPAPLRGFETSSTLVYFDAPERPHLLVAIYRLPDRARWYILAPGKRLGHRTISYRDGQTCYWHGEMERGSVVLEGQERERALLGFELRRALMTWPEGFPWRGEGSERSAELPGLGLLRAVLAEDGRPRELWSEDGEGCLVERLDEITWQELGGRAWPATLRLSAAGRPVWRERIEKAAAVVRYPDSFFVPPDHRPVVALPELALGEVRHADLPPVVVREFPVVPGQWSAVESQGLQRLREARAELAPLGLELEEPPAIGLDEKGRARSLILRLVNGPAEPPAGWRALGARPALTVVVAQALPLRPGLLESLLARIPPGNRAGEPYVRRVPGSDGKERVQLVVPLER